MENILVNNNNTGLRSCMHIQTMTVCFQGGVCALPEAPLIITERERPSLTVVLGKWGVMCTSDILLRK